jgi:DUF438 domain-containing protein
MSELLNNRQKRIDTLKHIIRHLHEGRAPEEVKAQLRALVRECDSTEIAQMEQELMADGVPVEEIMGMCDLHSRVVSEILAERPTPLLSPGHPVKTFQKENQALEQQVRTLRDALTALLPVDGEDPAAPPGEGAVFECRRVLNELMDIEKHYDRKENLLFSMLERHGVTGPSKVMWGKDDEVCEMLASLHESLMAEGVTRDEWSVVVDAVAAPALDAVEEMIFKEERILLPMALQTLTDLEWGEIWSQSPQYGWCLVDPDEGYRPPRSAEPADTTLGGVQQDGHALDLIPPARGRVDPPKSAVMFPTGALTPAQMIAMFSVLPVDLTFVDSDDRVRFFSEGQKRIFVRPKAVIGRKVQHCHPPASVSVVDEILDDFRSGRQDVADFWIELRGRFVFIRYFAVRDEHGAYMGTLEVTQDLTRERELTGERRLLEYDTPATANGSAS